MTFVVNTLTNTTNPSGVAYEDAIDQIELRTIEGVTIPFPSAELLLRMKQTYRDKVVDRKFLENKLRESRS